MEFDKGRNYIKGDEENGCGLYFYSRCKFIDGYCYRENPDVTCPTREMFFETGLEAERFRAKPPPSHRITLPTRIFRYLMRRN